MIIEAGKATRLSLDGENPLARYDGQDVMESSEPPAFSGLPGALRCTLELRRNLGGMVMRALIGGEFVAGSDQTKFEVLVASAPFDSGVAATCESKLGKPLIPGLPSDFAPAVLGGITAASTQDPLPAGVLRIDRAAHDLMGSSEAAFYQVAVLLRAAFSAAAVGADIENRLGQRLIDIPADQAG